MLSLASQKAQKEITQEGEAILPKRKADPPKPAWILAPRPGLEPGTCGLTDRPLIARKAAPVNDVDQNGR
jgi:hypothetical protein